MNPFSKVLWSIVAYFVTVLVMAAFGLWLGNGVTYLSALSFGDWWNISIIIVVFWAFVDLYRVVVKAITTS